MASTGRKKGTGMRRMQENAPGPGYLVRMRALGPRNGESLLAFEQRLAAIAAGRHVIADTAYRARGNTEAMQAILGLSRGNLHHAKARLGIDGMSYAKMMEAAKAGKAYDLDTPIRSAPGLLPLGAATDE